MGMRRSYLMHLEVPLEAMKMSWNMIEEMVVQQRLYYMSLNCTL